MSPRTPAFQSHIPHTNRQFWVNLTTKHYADYLQAIKTIDAQASKAFVELAQIDNTSSIPILTASSSQVQDVTTNDQSTYSEHPRPLLGIPFAIKDNIAIQGFGLTCGSKLLSEFRSPYTSHAVESLLDAGSVAVGKTNLDEFGMGSSTSHGMHGSTNNPWDLNRSAGGSSGGSAAAVAAGFVPFALGSDTGGSVRMPANLCGVWGFKPSYGSVSRYGLVAYASSFDVIGIIANDPSLLAQVYSCIALKPKANISHFKDASTVASPQEPSVDISLHSSKNIHSNSTNKTRQNKELSIGVFQPKEGLDLATKIAFERALKIFDTMHDSNKELNSATQTNSVPGIKTEAIVVEAIEYSASVYYILCTAEASANLARFDGIRYGKRDAYTDTHQELIKVARSRGLGNEVILRILTGTFVLQSGFQDQYYLKAQNLRTRITHELKTLFKDYDYILMPSFPRQAFRFDDTSMDDSSQKIADAYSVLANLAGIPAVSIPLGLYEGLPVGLQLMAPRFADNALLDFAIRCARSSAYRQLEGTRELSPLHKSFLQKINTFTTQADNLSP